MNVIAKLELVVVLLVLTLVGTVGAVAGVVRDEVVITNGPSGNPNPVDSAGDVRLNVTATDQQAHTLTYRWAALDNTGLAAGSFDSSTVRNPTWTAPPNTGDRVKFYRIIVVVTCTEGNFRGTGYWQGVLPIKDSVSITAGPTANPNPVSGGGDVQLSATATDVRGHGVTYLWAATDNAGNPVGSFDDPTLPNPVWTAPSNPTTTVGGYRILVVATCSHGKKAGALLKEQVLPDGSTAEITAAPSGSPNPVASGGTVACSANATDALGHTMTYFWTATGPTDNSVGSFDDPELALPVWTAPTNISGVSLPCRLSVAVTCSAGDDVTVSFREIVKPVPTGSDYVQLTIGHSGDPKAVAGGDPVQMSVTATDSLDHDVTFEWSAQDMAGNPAGSFNFATTQNPIWTAPANRSGVQALYSIKVVATCSAGKTAFASYTQGVRREPVPLRSSWPFAVLAGTTITNTGSSVVYGDMGVSPGSAVTGFPPGVYTGTLYTGADAVVVQAKVALITAYNNAAGRAVSPVVYTSGTDLSGKTLTPGLYRSEGTLIMSGDFWLDALGDADAVFVFQIPAELSTTGGQVILLNNAQARNIYWQVGTSATIGSTTEFEGNILADTSITLVSGATLHGRALAQNGAVTLDGNTITKP